MSWLSFFVDRTSAPARVSLGITTILTMTTLLIGIGQGSLPVVSYVKAVDWYLIVCYALVFGAFGEYILTNSKWALEKIEPTTCSHQLVSCFFSTVSKRYLNIFFFNLLPGVLVEVYPHCSSLDHNSGIKCILNL